MAINSVQQFIKVEINPINPVNFTSERSNASQSSSMIEQLRLIAGSTKITNQPKVWSIEDELTAFNREIQSSIKDFSLFWQKNRHRFPRLFQIARRVNIIPATSVPSESMFSVAGFVSRKQRSALSARTLHHLMVLKEAYKLNDFRSDRSTHMS